MKDPTQQKIVDQLAREISALSDHLDVTPTHWETCDIVARWHLQKVAELKAENEELRKAAGL